MSTGTYPRSNWIPVHLLRLDVGPLMRDSLVREMAAAEEAQSGRMMLVEENGRALLDPELYEAVRHWYKAQAELLAQHTPTARAARLNVERESRELRRPASVDEALRDREGGV
ncbi:hypothetical protein M2317_000816 [Microbacterium sp. ZKA21]|uniref:hypothetical protein n=1 Tax=Microbacterium sp. ZKA21 TaxID=3381694 RepID=UPI003D1D0246